MATFNVGRVQPIHKGEWSELTSYKEMDVVSLNGSSFWAIQDSTGLNPLDNHTYWEVIGEKGDAGVYVGSEEPTNPAVNVWIDTDGEPDVPQIEEHNTSETAHEDIRTQLNDIEQDVARLDGKLINLDNEKKFNVSLEIFQGEPRLKIEEVI